MTVAETIQSPNGTATISYCAGSESPRQWDNLGTLITTKNRHLQVNEGTLSLSEAAKEIEKDEVIGLPVYAYVRGAIALSTSPFSCQWDSGQIGVIYVSKEKVKEMYSCKRITKKRRARILEILAGEIETLSEYANGQVFNVEVKGEGLEDSLCGIIGLDNARVTAKDMLNGVA